jgi:hypothetical protein
MGMSRHLRFIPDGGALVEVTCRTVQGRLLLVPSPQLNDIILGVLGRAQRLYPVEIVAYVFASNHYHLVLRVDHAKQLSDFVGYFNSNLAKEVARRTGWKEKVWGRRYQAIVISDEVEVQVARLRYCLAHGVKEGLVSRVVEWPGVHCAVPLMTGAAVEGTWFDRTMEYNARLRGKELEKGESASTEVVRLSPLPCWRDLTAEVYRARVAEIVREIDETAAAARGESLIQPLGAEGSAEAESGDPASEDQEVAGAVLPCLAEEGAEGSMGGVWVVRGGVPGGGGAVAGRGSERGVPAWVLPSPTAVRGRLRRAAPRRAVFERAGRTSGERVRARGRVRCARLAGKMLWRRAGEAKEGRPGIGERLVRAVEGGEREENLRFLGGRGISLQK